MEQVLAVVVVVATIRLKLVYRVSGRRELAALAAMAAAVLLLYELSI